MEAKDTVMGIEVKYELYAGKFREIISRQENLLHLQDYKTYCVDYEISEALIEKQAEITAPIFYEEGYKAGMEEEAKGGHNAISYLEGVQDGHRKGIQEVVEWLERKRVGTDLLGAARWYASVDEWQSKKKEWGIE